MLAILRVVLMDMEGVGRFHAQSPATGTFKHESVSMAIGFRLFFLALLLLAAPLLQVVRSESDQGPPANPNKEAEKKKGSTIKDKEKNKRMKGQSSHASWKSETEMQLRQQFD
ncbi:unnamed protein product [Rhodiola kirilowii]